MIEGTTEGMVAGSLTQTAQAIEPIERRWLRLAAAGDADAFDRVVADRADGAYRTALAILRSDQDARDAVQESFVSAWRDLPRLRDLDRFDAWFGRILVNACRDQLRRRRRREIREIPAETLLEVGLEPAAVVARPFTDELARTDAIQRAFETLRPDRRALLVLHYVEARPVEAIAAMLGIPGGTVKWRLHAARRALDHALREQDR